MRKLVMIAVMAVACVAACGAVPDGRRQLTATEAFVRAPSRVIPTVDSLTRLDMLDYFNSGSQKASRNLLGGDCRVTAISDFKLEYKSSDVASQSLHLLPRTKGDTIIMVISTLATPAEDSQVRFYTSSWKNLDGVMHQPTLSDWLTPEGGAERADVENSVPFIISRADYDEATSVLTLTCHPAEYLPTEALPVAEKGLRETISYVWDGKRMKLLK